MILEKEQPCSLKNLISFHHLLALTTPQIWRSTSSAKLLCGNRGRAFIPLRRKTELEWYEGEEIMFDWSMRWRWSCVVHSGSCSETRFQKKLKENLKSQTADLRWSHFNRTRKRKTECGNEWRGNPLKTCALKCPSTTWTVFFTPLQINYEDLLF